MADLIAKSPCAGLLPVTIGTCTLEEMDLGPLTSVAPYKGADRGALAQALGTDFPAPNRASGGTRAIWFGRDLALVTGDVPDAAAHAAITDQTDAWACVRLSGAGAEDALARCVPVDLRAAHFAEGHSVRTQLQHLNVSITRSGPDSFVILGFRAMAGVLVHDIVDALESVAARG